MRSTTKTGLILFFILFVFFGGLYFMVQYRTFGGPQTAIVLNADFNYFEHLAQDKPEKLPLQIGEVKVPIIIYHSIRPHIAGESIMQDRFDITPELFEEQLLYLKNNGYTTISPDILAEDIKNGTTTPIIKPVMLTFDDGWENQYKYGFPLLKKYNMVATFYVYTKPIDANNKHYLSWDQVIEMSNSGMIIGSHTLSHPLMKHSTPIDIRKEIFGSKKVLEDELKKPVLHFAQPFGYTNPEIEIFIKEAGYVTARGTTRATHHSGSDIFHLGGYFISDKFSDFIYIIKH